MKPVDLAGNADAIDNTADRYFRQRVRSEDRRQRRQTHDRFDLCRKPRRRVARYLCLRRQQRVTNRSTAIRCNRRQYLEQSVCQPAPGQRPRCGKAASGARAVCARPSGCDGRSGRGGRGSSGASRNSQSGTGRWLDRGGTGRRRRSVGATPSVSRRSEPSASASTPSMPDTAA